MRALRVVGAVVLGFVLLVAALGALAALGWVLVQMETPEGKVTGPAPTPGLASACGMAPDVARRAVPGAVASRRTLTRRISECTLTGAGGRQLRIEVARHVGFRADDAAASQLRAARDLSARFTRRFRPPLQDLGGVGDQAYLSRGPGDVGAAATVTARRGPLVVVVRYEAPPVLPLGATAEPGRYEAVTAVATDALRAVLAGL